MTRSLLIDVPLFGMFWAYVIFFVPAAVICGLKHRWTLFTVGFLTLGLTWFFGAAMRGEAGSPWATRFYANDPEPETRAFDVLQQRRTMRTALCCVSAVLVLGLVASRPIPIVGVDGDSLQRSVGGILSFTDTCGRMDDGDWRCYAYDDAVSGDIPYRVKVGPLGCWKAKAIDESNSRVPVSRPTMSGCLTFFHVGVLNRVSVFD